MGWIGCIRCEKFRCDFVSRTFALVRPVLHRVSYGSQKVPNAPKWYETRQNVSLGSNGLDRVCSLRKNPTQLRGTNSCNNLSRFVLSFVRQPNGFRMHPNSTKRTKTSVLGPMGWIRCVRCEKFRRDFVARTFALVRPILHRVS